MIEPEISNFSLAMHYLNSCTPAEKQKAFSLIHKNNTLKKTNEPTPKYLKQSYWNELMPGVFKSFQQTNKLKCNKTSGNVNFQN